MQVIYSHTDFDGVVSASLLSIACRIDYLRFVSNNNIWYENFNGDEIIADLPCPWICKLWFDHHESNLNEMKIRGIEIEKLPGRFQLAPSCASIIYDYFKDSVNFPDYFTEIITETNKIDSMNYGSIEEWQKENAVKILSDTAQFLNKDDYKKFINYLIYLAKSLRTSAPDDLIKNSYVIERYNILKEEKELALEIMRKNLYFHSDDKEKEVIIIDTSEAKIPPRIDKNLAYIIKPDAKCVLLINSVFKDGVKTNNLKFSAGVNFTNKELIAKKNLSLIFEKLEIGGGHKSAAGAIVICQSKETKNKLKEKIIESFIKEWKKQ